MELVRYIHQNPRKAGLEKKVGEHPWTSHRYYLKKQNRPTWLKRDFVLQCFSKREKEALRLFNTFVSKGTPKELRKKLEGANWPAVLGGAKFKGWVKDRYLGKRLGEKDMPQIREVLRERTITDLKSVAKKLWS